MAARRSLFALALGFLATVAAPVQGAHAPVRVVRPFAATVAAEKRLALDPPSQADDFASGNSLTIVNGTVGVRLDPGGAIDNIYRVHYYVSVTINGHSSQYGDAALTLAFETNDGSGWIERGTTVHNCSYLSGPPPWAARTCVTSHVEVNVGIAGLAVGDSIRLKAKSFTTSNGAGGSFQVRGGDGAGVNPETFNGVTYSTRVTINSTAHNGDYRDVNKCVADCFDATLSYTTPAYISMNTPRAVTLTHRSSQARPMGFVQVDATDTTSSPPSEKMSIRLQRSDLTWVTFTTGSQEIFYVSGVGTSRLAAQFDAAALPTGAYTYTLVIRSWRGGSFDEATQQVRLLVLNEQGSPFGAGWTVAGLQRVLWQTGSSVVITEGNGSIGYFALGSCAGGSCSFTSPPGDFTTVTATGSPPSFTGYQRKYPDGTILTFNSAGRMTSSKDRFNNQTTYAYDASNRVSTITDPASKLISFFYGADTKVDSIRDPGTPIRTTKLTVNGSVDLTQITDPAGIFALRPTYGVEHQLTQRLDRRGSAWRFVYDFAGKLAADTMPTVIADTLSVRPVVLFGSPERAVLVDPASGLGTSANPAPRVLPATVRGSVTNPRGNVTQYALDRFGAPTRVEEPLGRTTVFVRNANSQVTADTSPSGHARQYTWSGPRLTQTVDVTTGRTININYELTYNQITKIYGDVDTVTNFWSGGKLDSTRRANRPMAKFLYDARGRITQATDPSGHITKFWYAATGFQNTDSSKAGARRTVFTYDSYGRQATVKNPLNYVTSFAYDSINRPRRTIGPIADTTKYDFDSLYLRKLTDPIGQQYRYARNALGWVDTLIDPGLRPTRYRYDRNGNITQVTNRRGQAITFSYDALDQQASRAADGLTLTTVFDPSQRFVSASNAESTDTLKFDVAGRRNVEISILGGTRYERTTAYNVRNLRTSLQVVAPWSASVGYFYNANMLLDSLKDWAPGNATRLTYDNELLLKTIVLPPPSLTIDWTALSVHVPSHVTYPSDATVNGLMGLNFEVDSTGLVTKRKKVAGDTTWTFTPDTLGRIKRYITNGGIDSTFTYDKVGNRTDLGGHIVAGNRLDVFNGDSLFYDLDGNLIKRRRTGADQQRLYWNSLGQLVAVWTNGADSVSFAYDGLGRRVRKWSATRTARFIWDGEDLIAELDGSGSRVAEYSYYPGIDKPHSVRRNATTVYYFGLDYPGHVLGLFSTGGSLVWQNRYSTFGSELNGFPRGAEPSENFMRFAGREFDVETGLYYMRARYYDRRFGRFISEDPIGLAGGINLYVYAGNNPMNFTDPSGLGGDPGPDEPPCEGTKQNPDGSFTLCPVVVSVPPSDARIMAMNQMGRPNTQQLRGGGVPPTFARAVEYVTQELFRFQYCTVMDCDLSMPFDEVAELIDDFLPPVSLCNPFEVAVEEAAEGAVTSGILAVLGYLGWGARGAAVGGPVGFVAGVGGAWIVCSAKRAAS